jgi:hypothetical protein
VLIKKGKRSFPGRCSINGYFHVFGGMFGDDDYKRSFVLPFVLFHFVDLDRLEVVPRPRGTIGRL